MSTTYVARSRSDLGPVVPSVAVTTASTCNGQNLVLLRVKEQTLRVRLSTLVPCCSMALAPPVALVNWMVAIPRLAPLAPYVSQTRRTGPATCWKYSYQSKSPVSLVFRVFAKFDH